MGSGQLRKSSHDQSPGARSNSGAAGGAETGIPCPPHTAQAPTPRPAPPAPTAPPSGVWTPPWGAPTPRLPPGQRPSCPPPPGASGSAQRGVITGRLATGHSPSPASLSRPSWAEAMTLSWSQDAWPGPAVPRSGSWSVPAVGETCPPPRTLASHLCRLR